MKRYICLFGLIIEGFLFSLAQYQGTTIYTKDSKIPSFYAIPDGAGITKNKVKTNGDEKQICKLLNLNEATSLVLSDTLTDIIGGYHETYKQFYKGVLVDGTRCVVHYDKDGIAKMISGNLWTVDNVNIIPRISAEQSRSIAITLSIKEDSLTALISRNAKRQDDCLKCSDGTLVVYMDNDIPHLAYKHNILSPIPSLNKYVYIDAENGDLLKEYSSICNISTRAYSVYSDSVDIETQYTNSHFVLRDYTRGDGIITLHHHGQDDYESSDNTWSNLSSYDRAAIDAHWGTEKTYDYYYSKFGRNSYDNYGSSITSYVNYEYYVDDEWHYYWPNAQWNNELHCIYFGREYNGHSYAALDVTAHEITHGVTHSTSNLVYERESGAINEGLSDIFGACVENEYKSGSDIWKCGEDILSGGLRDMSNPTCRYYHGVGWENTNETPSQFNDYCGVHTNSGVLGYWFYLLVHGNTGTNEAGLNYSVSSIGIDNTIQICYLANAVFLCSNSNYLDARYCTLFAAQSLGYDTNVINQIHNAWDAVGVYAGIEGSSILYNSSVYHMSNISNEASVNWSLSGNNASNFIVQNDTPSTNYCTIIRKEYPVNSFENSVTLNAHVMYNDSIYAPFAKMITTPYIDGPDVPCGVSLYSAMACPNNSTVVWSTTGQGLQYYTDPNGAQPEDPMAYVINNDGSGTVDGVLTADIRVGNSSVGTISRHIDEWSFFTGTWYQQATLTDTVNSTPQTILGNSGLFEIVPGRRVYLQSSKIPGATVTYSSSGSLSVFNWTNSNGVVAFTPVKMLGGNSGSIIVQGTYPSSCKTFRFNFHVFPTLSNPLMMSTDGNLYEFSIDDEANMVSETSRSVSSMSSWQLTIVDHKGRQVCSRQVANGSKCQVTTTGWKPGVYIAIAEIDGQYYSIKFSKK